MKMNLLFLVVMLVAAVYAFFDSNDNMLIGLAVFFVAWVLGLICDMFNIKPFSALKRLFSDTTSSGDNR
jgi:uncharacterized membrane protein